MIKRLLVIAVILGLGQAFIVFALKYISQVITDESFSIYGQTESSFQFLILLIAAGLLSDATRKITQTSHWQSEYLKYQSAKVFWSLLLLPLALCYFIEPSLIVLLAAPFIGLSGEYAFYGLGKPVHGAVIALVRIIIPYGVSTALANMLPEYFSELFVLLLVLTYFITGLIIAQVLKVPYFITPSFQHFRLYVSSLNLGLVNILIYLQGLGMMLIIPLLFTDNYLVISAVFIGLKFYSIFKSIMRIIHQALVKEMIHLKDCLTVDKLSMILSFTFLSAFLLFPEAAVSLLFGAKFIYATTFFQLMAFSCLVLSFCLSLVTNAVLMNLDRKLLMACILSAAACVGSLLIFPFFVSEIYTVGLALLTGEVILSIGLMLIYYRHNILKPRLLFVMQCILLSAVPFMLKYLLLADSLYGLLIGISIYALLLFMISIKEFNSVTLAKSEI